jgi:hypothetical protein
MGQIQQAISAAARCDTLTRRARVKSHNEELEKLFRENRDVLDAFMGGPDGDTSIDREVIGNSLRVITEGVFLAKAELEARVQQIRNHDDILKGLAPQLYRGHRDEKLSDEIHEYIFRLQEERKRCTVSPEKPSEYLAVPTTPWKPSFNNQWFHTGILFYGQVTEETLVGLTVGLYYEWDKFINESCRDLLTQQLSQIPYEFDRELIKEISGKV